jgi:hypothetical protein
MTLLEMSREYRAAGDQLRVRLAVLRKMEREMDDREESQRLQHRISMLTEMLRQVNELTTLTECYYERNYHKNEKYTV